MASNNNAGYLSLTKDGFLDYGNIKLDENSTWSPYNFEVVDWQETVRWMHRDWWVPHVTGVMYIAVIFGLQAIMKDKKPFDLRRELFWWNAALGIFSIFGFFRIAPQFIQEMFSSNGIYSAICYG